MVLESKYLKCGGVLWETNEIQLGFWIENSSGCSEQNDADYSAGIHTNYQEDKSITLV